MPGKVGGVGEDGFGDVGLGDADAQVVDFQRSLIVSPLDHHPFLHSEVRVKTQPLYILRCLSQVMLR